MNLFLFKFVSLRRDARDLQWYHFIHIYIGSRRNKYGYSYTSYKKKLKNKTFVDDILMKTWEVFSLLSCEAIWHVF